MFLIFYCRFEVFSDVTTPTLYSTKEYTC